MKNHLPTFVILSLLLVSATIQGKVEDPRGATSPNGVFRAQITQDDSKHKKVFYTTVRITRSGEEVLKFSLSPDKDNVRRVAYDAQWSPDSRFLVLTTSYFKHDKIWRAPTIVYDSKTNKTWVLDDFLPGLIDDTVTFTHSGKLRIQILESGDIPLIQTANRAVIKRDVLLSSLFKN
jgi:hypothetical protein